jgi:hypothetical protein
MVCPNWQKLHCPKLLTQPLTHSHSKSQLALHRSKWQKLTPRRAEKQRGRAQKTYDFDVSWGSLLRWRWACVLLEKQTIVARKDGSYYPTW